MNSIQLNKILTTNQSTKSNFKGVFARDELPKIESYPASFILNTEKRSHPGQHWIAFYFDEKKNCNFFDSYGNNPDFFKLKSYITKYSDLLFYNKKVIQGWKSENCGFYCILFLILRSSGYSLEKICDLFHESPNKNDEMIDKFKNKF